MGAGLGKEGASSFGVILDRLKDATNTKSDKALANALGLKASSVSNAKLREVVPPAWILVTAEKYGISSDWLWFGEGPMRRGEPQAEGQGEARPTACPHCRELEEDLRKEREMSRELVAENRELWRENGQLKAELAALKARAPDDAEKHEGARKSA